jgi:hypothetical protein
VLLSDRDVALSIPPAEIEDSVFDVFAQGVRDRWVAEPNLSQRRALAIACDVAHEVFGTRLARSSMERANAAEALAPIFAYIADSASPLVTLQVICACFGLLNKHALPMRALGGEFGISRQAFSKHVEKVRTALNIRAVCSLRPPMQRLKYQEVQRMRWAEIEQDAPRCHA